MAVVLQALIVVPAGAQARNLYVDRDSIGGKCNDALAASAVTVSKPWCTPARAISAAPEGATVRLRAGTYSNIVALNIRRSRMLTLKPARRETVTLRGSGTTDLAARAIYLGGSRNLRFHGFDIIGGAYIRDSSFVRLSGSDITGVGVTLRNVSDALVYDNEFHSFTGPMRALSTTGNVGESGAIRIVIRANEFHAIEHDAIALYWRLQDITVEDNYVHDIHRPANSSLHSDALQIAPMSEGSWGTLIVRRNRIIDHDQGLLIKDGITRGVVLENNVIGASGVFAAFIFDAPSARITNNTFANGRFYLRGATTDATVTNNIMRSFAVEATASVDVSADNLVDRTQNNPGYRPGRTDIAGRPSFVDASHANYRLTSASIGVDDGSAGHGAPSSDLVKNPRPSGRGHDIGAYERQSRASRGAIRR